jgi:hypothetical protein
MEAPDWSLWLLSRTPQNEIHTHWVQFNHPGGVVPVWFCEESNGRHVNRLVRPGFSRGDRDLHETTLCFTEKLRLMVNRHLPNQIGGPRNGLEIEKLVRGH